MNCQTIDNCDAIRKMGLNHLTNTKTFALKKKKAKEKFLKLKKKIKIMQNSCKMVDIKVNRHFEVK